MVILAYRLEKSINKQVSSAVSICLNSILSFQISNRYIISLALSDLIIGLEGVFK